MSLWQTNSWQEMLKKSKQISDGFLIDDIYIEKRSIGIGEFGLFVIACDFSKINEKILNDLINLCKKEKALFLQLENIDYYGVDAFILGDLKKGYYKKFITPYTAIIDLKNTTDEILAEMKPKGRYNIRLAEKKGILVEDVEKTKENVEKFYKLMIETTTRDSFSGNTLEYYMFFLSLVKDSKLLLASYEGVVISAGIFVYTKDIAIYYYGASTSDDRYRNLMAPYLLQWKAINIGKDLSCSLYDFLGVATPGDEKSSLLGVTDFKMKFTKEIREVSESYLFVNKKIKYFLFNLLRKLK